MYLPMYLAKFRPLFFSNLLFPNTTKPSVYCLKSLSMKLFVSFLEVTDRGFREVKEEIHLQRDDFKEMFKRKVGELRSEIAEIRTILARMQETE